MTLVNVWGSFIHFTKIVTLVELFSFVVQVQLFEIPLPSLFSLNPSTAKGELTKPRRDQSN